MIAKKPNESPAAFAQRQKKQLETNTAAGKAAKEAKAEKEARAVARAAEARERTGAKRYAKQLERKGQLAAIGTAAIKRQFDENPSLSPDARALAIEMAEDGDYTTARKIFETAVSNAEAARVNASRQALSARMGNGGPVQHAIVQRGSRITYDVPVGARDLVH